MSCRKLKRSIAKKNMEQMKVRRVNKHMDYRIDGGAKIQDASYFSAFWKEHFEKAVEK